MGDGRGRDPTEASHWREVVHRIRAAADPLASPDLVDLYQLAIQLAGRVLSRHADLNKADREDLACDVFARAHRSIVEADKPMSMFITCLLNALCSRYRKKKLHPETSFELGAFGSRLPGRAHDHEFVLDARAALEALSERDREILVAVAEDADRDELARDHGTTRGNIDQIVSRARRRFAAKRLG